MGKNLKTGTAAGVAQAIARTSGIIEIDPMVIRYTHSRIRPKFSGCGSLVMDTLTDLMSGKLKVQELPMIQVILGPGGHAFSLNNRRLFVLKRFRESGKLPGNMVRVRTRPGREKELVKFTVERCSLKAKLIRDKHTVSHKHDSGSDSGEASASKLETTVSAKSAEAAASSSEKAKIVGVSVAELDKQTVQEHQAKVEKILNGIDMDEDL